MTRGLFAVGMLALAAACLEPRAFRCEDDAQCDLDGRSGTCEEIGYCSYPDDVCPSRRRFGDRATGSLAGRCVPESSGASDSGSTSTATSTSDASGT